MLAGPANVWFGVGFNAGSMADKPYAVIVDGAGKVILAKSEQQLKTGYVAMNEKGERAKA